MQEIRSSEVNETKAPEVENYRNIQPENGMTVSEAKDFWNKEFTVEPKILILSLVGSIIHMKKG